MPLCAACDQDRPRSAYSKSQLKRKFSQRYKGCVSLAGGGANGDEENAPSVGVELPEIAQHFLQADFLDELLSRITLSYSDQGDTIASSTAGAPTRIF